MKTMLATGATLLAAACDRPLIGDPPAPPLQCQNDPDTADYVYGPVFFGASWRAVSAGFVVAAVLRHAGTATGDDPVAFPYDPQASGATLGAIQRDATSLQFELAPADGVSSIDLVIPVDCSGQEDVLYLRLDVSEPPQSGGYVPWSPNDPAS